MASHRHHPSGALEPHNMPKCVQKLCRIASPCPDFIHAQVGHKLMLSLGYSEYGECIQAIFNHQILSHNIQ
jgi:hypothetical protein